MPILRSRQHVGQDILLARHGSRICETRYDRRRNCVVATLDDGTYDTAPNLIAAGMMPPTISSILAEDYRYLAMLCAIYLLFAVMLTAGVMAVTAASPAISAVGLAEAYMGPFHVMPR